MLCPSSCSILWFDVTHEAAPARTTTENPKRGSIEVPSFGYAQPQSLPSSTQTLTRSTDLSFLIERIEFAGVEQDSNATQSKSVWRSPEPLKPETYARSTRHKKSAIRLSWKVSLAFSTA